MVLNNKSNCLDVRCLIGPFFFFLKEHQPVTEYQLIMTDSQLIGASLAHSVAVAQSRQDPQSHICPGKFQLLTMNSLSSFLSPYMDTRGLSGSPTGFSLRFLLRRQHKQSIALGYL